MEKSTIEQPQSAEATWTNESNIEEAIKLKTQGNAQFGKKQYKAALKYYHKCLLHLNGIVDSGSSMSMYTKVASPQTSKKANSLKYSIWLNMSQIYIFQQKYQKGLEVLKKAEKLTENEMTFDKDQSKPQKLNFRKATCYCRMNYFQEAKKQIRELVELDPTAKSLVADLQKEIAGRQKVEDQKSKQFFQGFFKK